MDYDTGDENEKLLPEDQTEAKVGDRLEGLSSKPAPTHPFRKWMDSFRIRKRIPPTIPERFVEGWPDASQADIATQNTGPFPSSLHDQHWEKSSEHSSHLGTVKTTTLSTVSQSAARSRANTLSTTNQSATSDVRASGDSSRPTSSNYLDEAAEQRATNRRRALREIVSTEADYVLGLTALTGVLSIINTRPQIYLNIQRIREIHEQFLTQLQEISPLSSGPIPEGASDFLSRGFSKRLGTIDLPGIKGLQNRSIRTKRFKATLDQRLKSLTAEPLECLEVVREIDKLSISFSAYEEFCRNYELLTQDVAILRRSVPNWTEFDQGIEALSKSVASTQSRKYDDNRSMSMNDLMIKPIQRLCKYPLLLQDLLRHTPVSDCPTTHDGIRQTLETLRILVSRINSETGNPVNKDRIHKTILLQGKIAFSETHALQNVYKELGPMTLCGVLHVTYQTPDQIIGDFMVCVLFNCYLFLARGIEDFRRLETVACIYVDDLKMDSIQNGRGLSCYGCAFSWKILFQEQEENYEFVLSASSAVEERHWKTEILRCSASLSEMAKPGGAWDPRKYSFVNIVLVPLDRVQYAVASLARRSSMDSMTISRKYNVQQVVIKKTHYPHSHDESTNASGSEIERPKEPAIRGPLTVAARRIDRIRLEKLVANVYSRNVLPFPGMVLGRGELFRRGTIMRRLSFHGGFNRRASSVSTSHVGALATDEDNGEERELPTGPDGCDEFPLASETECVSPKTPTSITGRSKTHRFRGPPKKSTGSVTSPRSEKRSSGNSGEFSPTRKKWTTLSLFGALSPKGLVRARPTMGPGIGD
ncbi:hypothetical protein N7532_012019 [Penicillium argentinense]|uniref:DH domain-containing protein n=1 Tax=Penicillium argentinense TaxID=1131581 RepID=A0A9W9EJT0_9EURO|nr:uncharacterized protein N7532_012019 [Penicillium argentinense]KAJ5082976.1 hypothetical protein N7532_012019 [Penicillium argentinense]